MHHFLSFWHNTGLHYFTIDLEIDLAMLKYALEIYIIFTGKKKFHKNGNNLQSSMKQLARNLVHGTGISNYNINLNMHLGIPSQQETYTKMGIIAYLHKPLNYFIIDVSFTSSSATKRSMEALIRNSKLW